MSGEIFCPRRWKRSGSISALPTPEERTYWARPTSKMFPRKLRSWRREEALERLRVGRRERGARPVEGVPAGEDRLFRALGDLHARAVRDREEALARAREEGHAAGGSAAFRDRLVRPESAGRQLRRRFLAVDLGRQRVELELHEEALQLLVVGRRPPERLRVERDRQVAADRGETPGEEGVLGVLPQALADLALDLARPGEELVEAAVLGDPLLGRDLAHARNARNVVRGVAHERQHVDDLPGRDPEELDHALLVEELLAARVEDADPAARDELEHVLVGRHDDDFEAGLRGTPGQGADDVVGFVARQLQDRDPVGLEDAADLGNLGREVHLHGGPVGLVAVVLLVPDRLLLAVEGHGQVVRRVLPEHLPEHRDEAVDGVGRPAGRGRKPPDRVVRPVDVGHGVHEVEGRAGLRHGSRILWRAARGASTRSKGPFGAPFRGAVDTGSANRGAHARRRTDARSEGWVGKGGAKNKTARPVAGVARFDLSSLRKSLECVKRIHSTSPCAVARTRVVSGLTSEALAHDREHLRAQTLGLLLEDGGFLLHLGHEGRVLDAREVDPDVEQRPLDTGVQEQGRGARRPRRRWGCPSRRAPAGRRGAGRPPAPSAWALRWRGGWRRRCASRAPTSVRRCPWAPLRAATTSS